MQISGTHSIDVDDDEQTDVYKRTVYKFVVANKEDSGHLVSAENVNIW